MNQQIPPPPSQLLRKGLSRTMKIIIAIVVVVGVAVASTAAILLSRPSPQTNTLHDISSVTIKSTSTDWTYAKGGFGFVFGIPVDNYDLDYYIVLQISNPTQYSALLKIYGEAHIAQSYLAYTKPADSIVETPVSFELTAYQTINFTIPPFSLDYYKVHLFHTEKNCDVPSSFAANITNVVVNELYREAIA